MSRSPNAAPAVALSPAFRQLAIDELRPVVLSRPRRRPLEPRYRERVWLAERLAELRALELDERRAA